MIRIALTDDRREVRQNLEKVLGSFINLDLIWSAKDGLEAVRQVSTFRPIPEVILMDIEMRQMNGIEATSKILAIAPEIRIIMLTIFEQEESIFKAIQAGASGYLLKDERPARLHQAILDAYKGRLPMSPLVAGKALRFLRHSAQPQAKSPVDYGLSPREIEILQPLAAGKTYSEIAEQLIISPNTVRSHIDNIYRKLSVNSKVEASNLAAMNRWFKLPFIMLG